MPYLRALNQGRLSDTSSWAFHMIREKQSNGEIVLLIYSFFLDRLYAILMQQEHKTENPYALILGLKGFGFPLISPEC